MNQFSLSWVLYRVSKLAALARALITLGSVDSPEQLEQLTWALWMGETYFFKSWCFRCSGHMTLQAGTLNAHLSFRLQRSFLHMKKEAHCPDFYDLPCLVRWFKVCLLFPRLSSLHVVPDCLCSPPNGTLSILSKIYHIVTCWRRR